ncbi:MAG: hypothetical protein QW223_07165 [Candidatus Caldarchaeum sp.]
MVLASTHHWSWVFSSVVSFFVERSLCRVVPFKNAGGILGREYCGVVDVLRREKRSL